MKNASVLNRSCPVLAAIVVGLGQARATHSDESKFVDCGSISNGLSVKAASVQPRQFACPRATLVGERYLRAVRKKALASVRISVSGATWICRERLYDTHPVLECVMRREPHETVALVS